MRKPKSPLLSKLISTLQNEIKSKPHVIEISTENPFSRRRFIKQSGKGLLGAAIVLSVPNFLTSCKNEDKNSGEILDVAILGAGISGLNCGNHFLKSKLNFEIFEASNRSGGRILTHYNDALGIGVFPEFGGDFVDSNHEDMLNLAKEFNLGLIDLEEEKEKLNLEKDIYFFENRKYSEEEVIKEFTKIVPSIGNDISSLGDDYDTDRAVELDNMPMSQYIEALSCAKWLKDLFITAFTAEFGIDCSEQSTLNFLDMLDVNTSNGFKIFGESDERYRIKGGNSKIIEGLVKKIGEEKIFYESVVSKIVEGVDGIFTIFFKNNKSIKSRKIVCTIPFNLLKNIPLEIKELSSEKQKCIDELGYGMNTKLILGYEDQPWRNETNKAMGYLFHPEISNGWDGSNNKSENNIKSAYVCYFGGEHSKQLNLKSFKNKLAPQSHVWKTELPESEVQNNVEILEKVFLGSKDKYLNKHVFVNWIDYPFTQGSYSCYKVGQWSTISGLEFEPAGNFFFAGEHCSENFQGYMNGGAETGRRVAEMVVGKI